MRAQGVIDTYVCVPELNLTSEGRSAHIGLPRDRSVRIERSAGFEPSMVSFFGPTCDNCAVVKKKTGTASPPVVSFKEEIAGRETLTAIAEERGRALFPNSRDRTTTRHYGDRISNAPGAVSPKVARAMDTSPEVSVSLRAPGRETYAIIQREHRHEMPEIEVTTDSDGELDDEAYFDTLEIERVHTFFIRAPLENFRSTQDRFRLVEQRLLGQMPGLSLEDITRIELDGEPSDEGILVRVFARVLE